MSSSSSSNISKNENEIDVSQSNSTKLGNAEIDTSEKVVDLIDSPKVHVIQEAGKDYMDIDIEHLDEGKFYHVVYHGDVYGIEKLADGQIAFYEVID